MENLLNVPSLWQNLKAETRPIVLYGMGDGADKIVSICDNLEIPIAGVFASDGFVRHNQFKRWTVKSLSELESEFGQLVVLLAFGSGKKKVMDFIDQIKENHILYIPDLPVTGKGYFNREYLNDNWGNFNKAYELFNDKKSRTTFKDLLYYKITGEGKYLIDHAVSREEMFSELFTFDEVEVFVDAGAYKGDTLEEFVTMTKGKYKQIFAIEPDGKNYRKLRAATENLKKTTTVEGAAWDTSELLYFPTKSGRGGRVGQGEPNTRGVVIDDLLAADKATYIKYDVEGAELKALKGSIKVIQNSYPKLLVSAYHRREDLFALALWLKETAPEYSFYLRRNQGYPAWDINLICIKE